MNQCNQFDFKYSNLNTMNNNGCNAVLAECDPSEDLGDFCADLKKRNTKWQCSENVLASIEKQKKAKADEEQVENNKKTCAYAEEECYTRGRNFFNSNKNSHTCEDFVRTCPEDKVKLFCTKHVKARGFTCNRSPAYKKRFTD